MATDFDELHLVVTHPVLGQFVAKKITDPKKLADHTYIDRTVNNLERTLRKRHSWPDCEPTVFVRRFRDGAEI
jgi:hypothetical protein